jgi:hypothetical protein
MFIVLSSFIVAAPPFLVPSEPSSGGDITIEIPVFQYLKYNSTTKFHFHIYNSTGKILTNATTTCNIHLYNLTNHIVR